MADTTASVAQCAATPALSPDAVQLHACAHNALSRCLRELRADATDYETLAQQMYQAKDAIETLRVMATFGQLQEVAV